MLRMLNDALCVFHEAAASCHTFFLTGVACQSQLAAALSPHVLGSFIPETFRIDVYGRVRSIASLDGETTHQKDWTDSGHVPAKWGFDTFLRVQIWKPTSYCTVHFWTKFSENFF